MKKLFFIFVIILSVLTMTQSLTLGQTNTNSPSLVWQKILGNPNSIGSTLSLVITKDNHYITVSQNSAIDSCQIISFLDNQGNLLWQKNLEKDTTGMHPKNCVELNDRSGFIVIFLDLIIKFDYQGNIIKTVIVPTLPPAILSVFKDSNYYYVTEESNQLIEVKIFVYDGNLNLVRSFLAPGRISNIASRNNYLYIAGWNTFGGIQTNASSDLSKYDTQGNLIWTKHLPDIILSNCAVGNDDAVYLSGVRMVQNKPYQVWELTKFNATGDSLWTKIWYGDYPVGSVPLGLWTYSLVSLPTGGCVILGAATQLGQDTTSPFFDPNLVEAMAIAYDSYGDISWKMRLSPTIRSGFSFGTLDKQGYLIISGGIAHNGFSNSTLWKYFLPGITAVKQESSDIPSEYSLSQNYPNPFNPSTTISFSVPQSGQVSLTIYDLLGRRVATLVNEELNAGNYKVKFDASQLSSGVYVYRLTAKKFVSSKKMILMK